MKISETWLREWVNPEISLTLLADKLSLAGFEVESISPAGDELPLVIVGRVIKIVPHPNADNLQICTVAISADDEKTIVCAAKNVRENIAVALALPGAQLPNNVIIQSSVVRDVVSDGMLCSAQELGLADVSEGIYILPDDAPIGLLLHDYLKLNDQVIEMSITPNRGDCLSLLGLAREISAITDSPLTRPEIAQASSLAVSHLQIITHEDCSHYVARVIKNVTVPKQSPVWLQERLRRSGFRVISPIVDITNYVMLELGQPMHAFDARFVEGNLTVRYSKVGETLELLNDITVKFDDEFLIVADEKKPLAIAGLMGGKFTSVREDTKTIIFESACFSSQVVAKAIRHFGFTSESAHRFERGVDPQLQRVAIERATELLLMIGKGECSEVIEVFGNNNPPTRLPLRLSRIEKILGLNISEEQVVDILQRLNCQLEKNYEAFTVTVPSYRSDLVAEIDLIEEIARINGYENIPCNNPALPSQILDAQLNQISFSTYRQTLSDLSYQEVITYSFIDEKTQSLFSPNIPTKVLLNPISEEMKVMRTSLWPGLIKTLQYNLNRQQERVRLFEIGMCFNLEVGNLIQTNRLAGLCYGLADHEQWSRKQLAVDFFDLKGDVENILSIAFDEDKIFFTDVDISSLHPGQSASIKYLDQSIGIIGKIHPNIAHSLGINENVFLFELNLDHLTQPKAYAHQAVSKYPEIRRDLAIVLDETIRTDIIQDTIKQVSGDLLKAINIFDVYQGKGISEGRKSVAISLTLQHPSRTLQESEIAELMKRVTETLKGKLNAELRG